MYACGLSLGAYIYLFYSKHLRLFRGGLC